MFSARRSLGILEFEIPPLERDGVVEKEPRGVFEPLWESIPGEILEERIRGVGKQEGNIFGSGWEESGESGEGIVNTESDAGDGAIGKEKNGSGGISVALDLSCNTFPVECILLKTAGVGEPRCVENTNLGETISLQTTFDIPDTHHYSVLARKLVKVSRVGLALVVETTSLVGVV